MKEKITAFIHNLILYDYALFGGVFLVFLLLIVLVILLRNKMGFAVFLFLFSLIFLFLGPLFGYIEMHKFLFKNEVTLIKQKKLKFLDAIVVNGTIKNISKFNFKECEITASVHKVGNNILKQYLYKYKPIKNTTIKLLDINKQDLKSFKIIIEPFKYTKDYNISLGANCK